MSVVLSLEFSCNFAERVFHDTTQSSRKCVEATTAIPRVKHSVVFNFIASFTSKFSPHFVFLEPPKTLILNRIVCVCSSGREEGVISVLVGLMAGKADVRYRPDMVTPEQIVAFIEDLGFGAVLQENRNNNGSVELNVGVFSSCLPQ